MPVRVFKSSDVRRIERAAPSGAGAPRANHISSGAPPSPAARVVEEAAPGVRKVLNAGSGALAPHRLHAVFRNAAWAQITLDVEPRHKPDIVCSIINMRSFVETASIDAIWSSHNIEHLHAHEVPVALAEFARVLKPNGFALIRCPNLDAVARKLLADGLDSVAYVSPAGPITPLDMIYGHTGAIARGDGYMRHHSGFTLTTLAKHLMSAGFETVHMLESPDFDLWALALKSAWPAQGLLDELALHGQRFES